ncbi:MAG: c-type cytochrome [Akkermansiaceae bacterium]
MRSLSVLTPILASLSLAHAALKTTFTSGEESISSTARMPALFVEKGTPPVQGMAPGAFNADFEGTLTLEKRSRLTFSFEGNGQATLFVNDEEVLKVEGDLSSAESDRLRLNPGDHSIKVSYQSPEDGSGSFRLFWAERKAFPREPMPSTAFKSADQAINAAHLVASHNCTKCHETGDLGKLAMPELAHSGPDLTHIGDRVTEEWLVRWIAEPDKLKHTTTMPAMVNHKTPEGAQEAADLAAYLATLKKTEPSPAPDKALAKDGGVHFHNLGCVACHTLPSNSELDFDQNRIPLNNTASKYRGDTLVKFLKNPAQHHKAIKMPNFRLNDSEAQAIAAFLTQESTGNHTPDPSEFAPGDAARGKEVAIKLNCASCHIGLPASSSKAPKLSDLKNWSDQGCLGPDEKRGNAPRLILSKKEKEALVKAGANLAKQIRFDSPSNYATRQTKALRCNSCHEHDGKASLLTGNHAQSKKLVAHIEGHAEKLEQSRPPLTHMGAMLHTAYLEKMLLGTAAPRPRPWLDMRMPSYDLHAKTLAKGLAHQHGLPTSTPPNAKPLQDQIETGKMLAGMTGYACVTCHGIGDQKAVAAFEVQGINFALAHERLRTDYYLQWMHNPTRMVPGTKMPKYTNDDGSALRPDILDGDSRKQFEAIKAYFQSLTK